MFYLLILAEVILCIILHQFTVIKLSISDTNQAYIYEDTENLEILLRWESVMVMFDVGQMYDIVYDVQGETW
jgi:hypothetical protein